MTRPVRVMFYVQHLLGIGHLARASRIAQALATAGAEVTLVTGGMPVAGFPPQGVGHVALPPMAVGAEGFAALVDADSNPVDDAFRDRRRALLLDTFDRLSPDALLIEAYPFGRRQVRFELLPLLEAAHARQPRPVVLSSLRDILQESAKPGRNEETVDLVQRWFDRVLVHGDPRFARLDETFPLAAAIADRITYTGLVAPPEPGPPAERFDVIASAGGGAVGADLIRAAMGAAHRMDPALRWCLIAGPNLPQVDFDALAAMQRPGIVLERFRPDFASLLGGARVSVSQAGYNTVCDILRGGCHAVLVPFASGGETEQTQRAERLAALGRADVISESALDPEGLAATIAHALDRPQPQPLALDMAGAETTARLVIDLASGTAPSACQ